MNRKRAWVRLTFGVLALVQLAGCVGSAETKKNVRESEGYYKEGVSFLESDQQRAFVSFQKAINLNPDSFDAHYALGSIYFKRKELANAEREFRIASELNPTDGETLNYLGRTLLLQGRRPQAIDALRKAAKLPMYAKPDIAYTDLASVLEGEGDLAGAVDAYQSALRTDPPNVPRPFIYLWLGRLYMKQGDARKARIALSEAKTLDQDGIAGVEASRLLQRLK